MFSRADNLSARAVAGAAAGCPTGRRLAEVGRTDRLPWEAAQAAGWRMSRQRDRRAPSGPHLEGLAEQLADQIALSSANATKYGGNALRFGEGRPMSQIEGLLG